MNRRAVASVGTLALFSLLPFTAVAAVAAAPGSSSPSAPDTAVSRPDNRLTPAGVQRGTRRQTAIDQLVSGEARLKGKGRNRTIEMADGTLVDYPVTQSAKLLTFLVDFGDGAGNPAFPDQTAGPVHNQIPEPGSSDNSTYWKDPALGGFNRAHYLDMFFNGMPEQDGESFKQLYAEMSSGRFGLSGDVSDWVSVDHPESYYSEADGSESNANMKDFISDSATAWFEDATADMTPAQVKTYLAQFDVWDRYDSDNDGVFNESDGYIDHFQAIHAGPGEEAGAEPWTIWSHRSGANYDPSLETGPACESATSAPCFNPGGVEIGDTGYWIFDYTTEPENGGLGVFAHEFGHDLGLPDYYDTQSSESDNSTGFWNLMSAGSWLSHAGSASGTTPNHMGAVDKLYLGWYGPGNEDLAIVDGQSEEAETVTLGPSYHATTVGKQAVLVTLPDASATIESPVSGGYDESYIYSGNQNSYDAMAMSPPIEIPDIAAPSFSAHVAYSTEAGFDYAYLAISTDDGESWENIATSESTDTNPEGANLGHGITGGDGSWKNLTADLTDYAGETVRFRWEYLTDGAYLGDFGFVVDDTAVTDGYATTFTNVTGWDLVGFSHVDDGVYTITYPHSYIAENRQNQGYDRTLQTGPYSWDYNYSQPPFTKADRFGYEDGLLIWYLNGRYSDNNTSAHPGGGYALPVDASAQALTWEKEGGGADHLVDSRLQPFDATFDVDGTSELQLTQEVAPDEVVTLDVPARPSVPVFEDSDADTYYDDSYPGAGALSTRVGGTGTEIQVMSSDESTGAMELKIGYRFVAAVGKPEVAGDSTLGDTLTAVPPTWFQDGVTDSDPTWLRDGEQIEGATGTTYEITSDDTGHTISVVFTGSKAGYSDTTVESDGVEADPDPAPSPTATPAISGTAQVGQNLTAVGATWPVDGDSSFAWSIGGEEVGTGPTYLVKPGDAGKVVRLTETFQSPGHEDATPSVDSPTVVKGAAPSIVMPADLDGVAQVGSTLTVTGAVWSQPGTSTFSWSVDGTEVGTGIDYVVTPDVVGKVVRVTETRTSTGYEDGTTTVDSATVVPGTAPTATTPPKVTGTARVGSTLKVVGVTWPRAGTSTYAWTVGGKTVGTGTSYALRPADAGKRVTVTETFASPGYSPGTASAQSGVVAKAPVSLKVAVGKAKPGKKVSVSIRATAPGLTVPGKVKVSYGGKSLGSVTLKSGKATVKLPAKARGSYKLKVTYAGATGFGTAGRTITVKVR